MPLPDVSVIIVSYNTRDLLAGCLRSLRRVEDEARIEVIVIDNASQDGSVEMVRTEFPEVRLIVAGSNLGFAAANNLGIAAAQSELLLFLNPDTLATRHAIRRLVTFLSRNRQASVAGAMLIYPDGIPQSSHFRFPSLFREFWNYIPELKSLLVKLKSCFMGTYSANKEPFMVECVSGAAFMAKRSVIDDIGKFDDLFFLYHEEMDLCTRIRKHGGQVWFVPDATVVHWNAQSSGYTASRFPYEPLLGWRTLGMDRLWAKHATATEHRAWRRQTKALLRLRIALNSLRMILASEHHHQIVQRKRELKNLIEKLSSGPIRI